MTNSPNMSGGGLSSGQIARVMGLSRNAVSGRISRLALKLARHVGGADWRTQEKASARVPRVKPPKQPAAARIARVVIEPEILGPPCELVPGCKWIHGDPTDKDWRQCGQPRAADTSWCEHHFHRTHTRAIAQDRSEAA